MHHSDQHKAKYQFQTLQAGKSGAPIAAVETPALLRALHESEGFPVV